MRCYFVGEDYKKKRKKPVDWVYFFQLCIFHQIPAYSFLIFCVCVSCCRTPHDAPCLSITVLHAVVREVAWYGSVSLAWAKYPKKCIALSTNRKSLSIFFLSFSLLFHYTLLPPRKISLFFSVVYLCQLSIYLWFGTWLDFPYRNPSLVATICRWKVSTGQEYTLITNSSVVTKSICFVFLLVLVLSLLLRNDVE